MNDAKTASSVRPRAQTVAPFTSSSHSNPSRKALARLGVSADDIQRSRNPETSSLPEFPSSEPRFLHDDGQTSLTRAASASPTLGFDSGHTDSALNSHSVTTSDHRQPRLGHAHPHKPHGIQGVGVPYLVRTHTAPSAIASTSQSLPSSTAAISGPTGSNSSSSASATSWLDAPTRALRALSDRLNTSTDPSSSKAAAAATASTESSTPVCSAHGSVRICCTYMHVD